MPAEDYSIPEHKPYEGDCCRRWAAATWEGKGPVDIFCGRHPNKTLPSQYRFLPALAHARRTHLAQLEAAARKWVVLVDDDSFVSLPRLLQLLGQVNHSQSVQLGDFVRTSRNETHWIRPFACGGGGTVLSRAAVLATDFHNCARRFAGTCMQSDWMIAFCLGKNVLPVTRFGCRACMREGPAQLAHVQQAYVHSLRHNLLEQRCAFAQFTFAMERFLPPHNALPLYAFAVPAIQHHVSGRNLVSSAGLEATDRSPFYSLCTAVPNETIGLGKAARTTPAKLVLVVGAQKAATSSLHSLLTRRLGFAVSPAAHGEPRYFLKEKHFYDVPSRCDEGFEWYVGRYFPGQESRYVDATPYLGQPFDEVTLPFALTTATRAFYSTPAADLARVQLVAVLREPVARLRSWHDHMTRSEVSCDSSTCEHYSCGVIWACVGRLDAIYRTKQMHYYWTTSWQMGNAAASHTRLGLGAHARIWHSGKAKQCSSVCAPVFDVKSTSCLCMPPRSSNSSTSLAFQEWLAIYGSTAVLSGVYAPQVELWRRYASAFRLAASSLSASLYNDGQASPCSQVLERRSHGEQLPGAANRSVGTSPSETAHEASGVLAPPARAAQDPFDPPEHCGHVPDAMRLAPKTARLLRAAQCGAVPC